MIIYACTTNAGKLKEISEAGRAFSARHLEIQPLPGLEQIAAPEETGSTFEENAGIKAKYYSQFTSGLVLAEDSGLEVDSLGGAPGIYSARYSGASATDLTNNALLLRNLRGMSDRRCRFVCAVALAQDCKIIHLSTGIVEGVVLELEKGSNGFGYDPLFFCPALGKSFAELTSEEKLKVSHRGRALRHTLLWFSGTNVTSAPPKCHSVR